MADNWPVVHHHLKPRIHPIEGDPYWRTVWDGDIPDDLADELNRLATIDACAKMIDNSVDGWRGFKNGMQIALVLNMASGRKEPIISLYHRLKKEQGNG